jgi:hypothetical protein
MLSMNIITEYFFTLSCFIVCIWGIQCLCKLKLYGWCWSHIDIWREDSEDSVYKFVSSFSIWIKVILCYYDTTTLWYYDTMILRYYDTTLLWYYDTTILRHYDTTLLRYYDTTILRYYDTTLLRYYVTTILRYYVTTLLRYCDTFSQT